MADLDLRLESSIVVLTGAGISKESGLDTFRDADGLWSKVSIEDVATPEAFQRDPVRVHDFYNARRSGLLAGNIRPNAAHEALARLEREWPGEFLLVTQNIDNLHERAGSQKLVHMHGELLKARCLMCAAVCDWREPLSLETACPGCGREGGMRVHVVWFGEMPFQMEEIFQALSACDLFVSIGTSGNVYPAAGFVQEVKLAGSGMAVELNLEHSAGASLFDIGRYGEATRIVPEFVEECLTKIR